MYKKFQNLLQKIDIELKKAEEGYKNAKKSALEIAKSASLSPSQAGDRFHSQCSADLAKERYDAVLAFKNEVEQKGESIFINFEGKDIVLVDNPIIIPGFTIASTKSPLGQKLIDMKP